MSASRKPRTIVSVTPYVRPDGAKRCKVEIEDGGKVTTVALHDLTRPELGAAARKLFPNIPGNVWFRMDTPTVQGLIRDNDEAAARAAVEDKGAGNPAPKAPAGDAPATPQERPHAVEEAAENALGANAKTPAEQLADLLGQLATGPDLDAIKAEIRANADATKAELSGLVDEAKATIQKAANEVRITRIAVVLPDGERQLPKLHHFQLPKLIAVISAGCHAFLVGPAGTGKSVAGEQAAEVTGRGFEAISFGPTTPTSKLFGFNDANGNFQDTGLHRAFTGGKVFLGDEMDNGHPGLLAEQNQFLANRYCAFANGMAERHADFVYIATGNTYGKGGDRLFVGRNQLDAATLDRFVFIEWMVDENIEEQAALANSTTESAPACREWIQTVRRVRSQVADQKLQMVVSPRASIDGCKLITTGCFTRDEVIASVLFKGAGESITSKLKV